ncbi:MAG TPA: phosphoethanolamine transferase [Edaphocola sp.]|nr:phosphoethanolamine transferase [Edaphocola sp.]
MKKRQRLYFIILSLILFIPNFFALLNYNDIKGNLKMSVAYTVLALFVWALPLIFLKLKTFFIINFFFLLASPIEIIFVKSLGTPHTVGFIDSIFKSNLQEASEQLSGNLLMVLIFILIVIIYIILTLKIKNTRLNLKTRLAILFGFLLFNVGIFFQMYSLQKGAQSNLKEKLDTSYSQVLLKYSRVYPSNLLVNLYRQYENQKSVSKLEQNLVNFDFQAISTNPIDQEEIYVLVLGETARFESFHINGYHRETTPYLDTTSNLLSFQNVYTQANLTSMSIPQIITRSSPLDFKKQFFEKTIADAFKQAGFYTAWFANQSSENPIIKRMQDKIDYFKTNNSDINLIGYLDEAIVPEYEIVIQNKSKKKFIVIHSLGSHFRYSNRYPKTFEKFTPALEETGYNNLDYNNRTSIINAYDNSILYTDYFLHLLIQELDKTNQKAVLLYVSDHGENLYDDDKRYFAHGTVSPTKHEYHIPYFIWYSKKYEESEPQKIQNLKNNINVAISSGTTFYTLLDLANISYKDSVKELEKSLASDEYKIPKERMMLNSEQKIIYLK